MPTKILGICGSPVKKSSTELFLGESLKAAAAIDDVSTEMVVLSGKDIKECLHCNYCIVKQKEEKVCAQLDSMVEIWPKLIEADGYLFATPVYFSRLSGLMACLVDRLRSIEHGKHYRGVLANKPAGALAVIWFREGGAETALLSLVHAFLSLGMIPACGYESRKYGAVGLSSPGGEGQFDPKERYEILKDKYGLESARVIGRRVVQLAKALKMSGEVFKK